MPDAASPRPRQVSLSAWLTILGSVFVVLLAYQRIATLGSLETQEEAERLLADPPGSGLGIGVSELQSIWRVTAVVAGVAAAAALVLGIDLLRRKSSSTRWTLTALAPVVAFAGLAVEGFAAVLVAVAIGMLWSRPVRAWYRGDPDWQHAGMSQTPPPPPPSGPSGSQPYGENPYGGSSYTSDPYGGGPTAPAKRPGTVTAASIITAVLSGLTFVFGLIGLIGLLVSRDEVVRELDKQLADNSAYADINSDDIVNVIAGVLVVLLIWTAIAAVLAIVAMRGANWARITVVVSSVFTALFSLIGITALVTLVTLIASIAVIVLYFTGGANQWYAAQKQRR